MVKSLFKRWSAVLVLAVCLGASGPARAGIPVIDVASLVQAIQQVLSWYEQYAQMVEQIRGIKQNYDQLKAQYDTITNYRGWGNLLLKNPGEAMGKAVTALSFARAYDCSGAPAGMMAACQSATASGNQLAGRLDTILQTMGKYDDEIDKLRTQMASTTDLKAAAEYQSRITLMQGLMQNAQGRVAATIRAAEEEKKATEAAYNDKWLEGMKSGASSMSRSFSYP